MIYECVIVYREQCQSALFAYMHPTPFPPGAQIWGPRFDGRQCRRSRNWVLWVCVSCPVCPPCSLDVPQVLSYGTEYGPGLHFDLAM